MKRSKIVQTGLLLASISSLTGCDIAPESTDPAENMVYTSLSACEEAEGAGNCAVPMTAMNKPRFNSKLDCEEQFGGGMCESGGDTVAPLVSQTDNTAQAAPQQTQQTQQPQNDAPHASSPVIVWTPHYIPNATYYYPGLGYAYAPPVISGGSPRVFAPPISGAPAVSSGARSIAGASVAARGGFGTAGHASGGFGGS